MLNEGEVRQLLYIIENKPRSTWTLHGINIKFDVSGYCEALRDVLQIKQ